NTTTAIPQGNPTNFTSTTIHGCSYDAQATEYIYLPTVATGQIYVILITNFANQPGTITFNQTGGSATVVCPCPELELGNDIVLCGQSSTVITANTATQPDAYQWFLNGILIPGQNSNTLTVTSSGTYSCQTPKAGCPTETDSVNVTIHPNVNISDFGVYIAFSNWTIANGAALCPNTCRLAKSDLAPRPNTTYQWFKNNVLIPGATNYDFNICEPGTYKVVLNINNGQCILEDTILVEFFPDIIINTNQSLQCNPNGTYNLNLADELLFPNADGIIDSFYTSLPNLISFTNPITNLTNYPGTPGDIIYCTVISQNGGNCVYTASFTLAPCVCSTITNPIGTQNVCINGDPTQLCVTTSNTDTNGIKFVFFNTQQTGNAMYTGGTLLGNVTPSGGNACFNPPALGSAGSLPNVAGTYFVYAILNPTPTNPTCRPFQQIVVTVVNSINAGTLSGTQAICVGATTTITSNGTTG
ncbi:MAG: hypothetical protein ACOVOV_06135, partial [Dolichospermum sp.]